MASTTGVEPSSVRTTAFERSAPRDLRIFLALDQYCPGISLRSTAADWVVSACSVVASVVAPRLLSMPDTMANTTDKAKKIASTIRIFLITLDGRDGAFSSSSPYCGIDLGYSRYGWRDS